MGLIYCLTFPNGKKYIGQTTQQLKARLQQHSKQKYCIAVHNAIRKYKEYECEVLLEIDNASLDYYEEKLIKEHHTLVPNGYNIRLGGRKSGFSQETIKKMSESHKGKHVSEAARQAISRALTGRILSKETRQKISISKQNSVLSEESKRKMSRKGMKHTDESKTKVSLFNKGKQVQLDTRIKLSQSLRQYGTTMSLPLYVHRKEQKPNSYHGSGYIVRVPGFKSKSFISKKLTDEEKYNLALKFLESIQYDKRSTTK